MSGQDPGANKRTRSNSWDDEYLPNLPRPPFHRHPKQEPSNSAGSTSSGSADGLPSVHVIHIGHSRLDENTRDMYANCTVTLIKGCKFNILVDTMTAWDGQKLQGLLLSGLCAKVDKAYWLIFL